MRAVVKDDSESRKQAKEIIKILEHWLNGGKIQLRAYSGIPAIGAWLDLNNEDPKWNEPMTDYRIKPEPRTKTVWVVWNAESGMVALQDKGPVGEWSAVQIVQLVEGEIEK